MILARKMREWLADPVEHMALQVPRALVASVLALMLDVCILEICLRVAGMTAVAAAVVGYLTGTVLQYVLCAVWVFANSLKPDAGNFAAFILLSLVGLAITWGAMLVGHEWSGASVEVAKCAAVGLAFTWNFLSRKYLLFGS